MENYFFKIQELLTRRVEFQTRLTLLAYDGTPEIKVISGRKYLYIRKRELGKIKSTYVGEYSEELHNLLLKNNVEAKSIKKEIRHIEKELALLGYKEEELSERVVLNIDFARSNMKKIIYDQAVLEGVATTFPDTETILENGMVNNVKAEDVQKIINLKHAWQFIVS